MSTFKIGERVRVVRPFDDFKVGQIVTIRGFECDDDVAYVAVDGSGAVWDLNRFEKVEPEFVVGQQVRDEDYDRLPIGAVTSGIRKVGEHEWQSDKTGAPVLNAPYATRFLTYLPDATEPEDKDDLYVEPEPLKEGDWCLIWAQFDTVEPDDDGDVTVDVPGSGLGTQYVRADAIVRPSAGQVPPWVKPAPLTIDPSDEDGQVAELAHAIADHCGVSVTFADLAKALAERSAAEGGAS